MSCRKLTLVMDDEELNWLWEQRLQKNTVYCEQDRQCRSRACNSYWLQLRAAWHRQPYLKGGKRKTLYKDLSRVQNLLSLRNNWLYENESWMQELAARTLCEGGQRQIKVYFHYVLFLHFELSLFKKVKWLLLIPRKEWSIGVIYLV